MSLIEGVYRHRLVEFASPLIDDPVQGGLALAAIETCHRIGEELAVEVDRLRPVLDDAGIEIDGVEPVSDRQNHTITFLVADADAGEAAVEALRPLDYEPWERWRAGALESFRRSGDQVTSGRTDGLTTVVRFRWRPRRHRGPAERALTPTAGDWHLVQLPTWAWWAYPAVRVGRLLAERLGLRPRHRASLGPFLSTPDSLLEPLFEHVGVTADDVVVDLGAGDGRVVAAAAARYGCRAMGVEHDPQLVEAARRRIATAGIEDRATVDLGDARDAELAGATVVIVFLPIDVVADLFDDLMARLAPGTRVLVHEQSRLPATLHPDSSTLIVGPDAVTVAHVWTVGRAPR
ncbi:SAM-dependent methyltransferase [Ilumatobacter sp.]|uniref:SAM-dependent methyltransferase n=1 Tax=Ilumatobacter sp. TaxID=1967498 RepID=UPI003AF9559A